MPDPITGGLAAVSAGGAILNFFGGQSAAKQQAESAQAALDVNQSQFAAAEARNQPATDLLAPSINQLQGAIDAPQQGFDSFLNAQPSVQSQIGDLSSLARSNVLASAEATGNLGGSSTINNLLRIAPELAFKLEDRNRFNAAQDFDASNLVRQGNIDNLSGLVNTGLSGANQTNILGQSFATNQANLLNNQGSINAGASQVGAQAGGQFLTDISALIRNNQLATQPPAPVSASTGVRVN